MDGVKSLTFGSLFSGIGGIDLGFERAGLTCEWQVEIDDYCNRVLAKHWPDVKRYRDVKEVHGIVSHSKPTGAGNNSQAISGQRRQPVDSGATSIRQRHGAISTSRLNTNGTDGFTKACPSCLPPVDVITGGFPCQPHSVAGKRKGAADDRNLWPEYLRIITELRPTWVVGENVPGIITTYLDTVLSDLEGAGYEVSTFNLPAVAFDAKHRRERIFVVAYADKERLQKPQHEPGKEWADRTSKRPRASSKGRWPTEPDVGRVAHGVSNRVDRLRGLGNAVVPQVAEFIGRAIVTSAALTSYPHPAKAQKALAVDVLSN